jgi:predicted ATP-grasp superfamily ATP-dependent carboligase
VSAGRRDRDLDVSTPVLVFRAEDYGALNAIRSLGRLGVKVYGLDRSERSFGMRSRYLAGRFVWDFDAAPASETVSFLRGAARVIGGRPILLHTGDSTAGFLAAHGAELEEAFLFPVQPPGLVERLTDKRNLHDLCKSIGVPTADTLFPTSAAELPAFLDRVRFPLMLKGIDGRRLQARTGLRMIIVRDRDELLAAYARLDEPGCANLMLQEYIPGDDTTVWMFDGYFDAQSRCRFGITGQKLRQFPVHVGMTSLGICLPNEVVEGNTRRLAQATGYRGIIDIGHRFDARDGQYKVLDVNPRPGVTFRLFVDANGMDVIRALYLDLTGQPVPATEPTWGRKWVVEDKDLISSWRYRQEGSLSLGAWARSFVGVEEAAYFAPDDLAPFAGMVEGWAERAAGAAYRRTARVLGLGGPAAGPHLLH